MAERNDTTSEANPYDSPQHGAEPRENRYVAVARFVLIGALVGLAMGVIVAGILTYFVIP